MSLPQFWRVALYFGLGLIVFELGLGLILPEGAFVRGLEEIETEIQQLDAPDIQIFGDSVAYGGIWEEIVAESLGDGRTVGNYSIPGICPLFARSLLEDQLAAEKKPEAIVVAFSLAKYSSPSTVNFLSRHATSGEMLNLLGHGVGQADVVRGHLGRLSYTLRYQAELRQAIVSADPSFFRSLWEEPKSISGRPNRFAKIDLIRERSERRFQFENLTKEQRLPFTPTESVQHSLWQFFQVATDAGVDLYLVAPPITGASAECWGPEGEERWLKFSEKAHRDFGIVLLGEGFTTYPDDHFRDPWHLSGIGAGRFSRELGDLLRKSD